MIRVKFKRDGQDVGVASLFGGRVVHADGDTPGMVMGTPEDEAIPVVDSPPHGYEVEVVDETQSMHDQALFRRDR